MKLPKLVECKSLGLHLSEDAAREVDAIVAGLPKDASYRPRQKALMETGDVDPTERTDVSVISTDDVDSQHDIVVQGGIDFSVFDRNRVVLHMHDHERPVGKCLWYKAAGNKTIAKTQYPVKPGNFDGEWLSDKVFALTQAGIMSGKSVTILPVELADPSPEQRQKGCEIVWNKCVVLEYSTCAIPANANCLVTAVEKGLDLSLLGITKTGQKVKPRTKRIEYIDRTPELIKAVERMRLDPAAITAKVLDALKNRGRV